MTALSLTARYALFAVAATAVNLLTQHLSLSIYDRPPLGLLLAMAAGTGTGLALKYVLDKRWIFRDLSTGLGIHARKFGLYSLMGVVTTAVFWGTEIAFDVVFRSAEMRYVGAALGLAIGYTMKYLLDRRFVFDRATA